MFNHENFKKINTEFNGLYFGVVESNNDPKKMGRCRIRILGLHTSEKKKSNTTGIPTSELPWALPMNSIAGGSVSGLGENGVPVNGSWVVCGFINNDHNYPFYLGTIGGYPKTAVDKTKGFNDPDGIYPKILNEPDWNKYARGSTLNDEKNANLETFEPSSNAAPIYPNNTVFETPDNGIIVEYDSTPNAERWHIYHKASKSYMEILSNGDTVFKSTNNRYEITSNERKIFIKNNDTQQIDGNLQITVNGNVSIKGKNGSLKGVVQGDCICAFTGQPHPDISNSVELSK